MSVAVGIATLGNLAKMGRLAKLTIGYYFLTTSISVVLGVILVVTFRPGDGVSPPTDNYVREAKTAIDFINTMVPSNFFKALVNQDAIPIILVAILFGIFTPFSCLLLNAPFRVSMQDFAGCLFVMERLTCCSSACHSVLLATAYLPSLPGTELIMPLRYSSRSFKSGNTGSSASGGILASSACSPCTYPNRNRTLASFVLSSSAFLASSAFFCSSYFVL